MMRAGWRNAFQMIGLFVAHKFEEVTWAENRGHIGWGWLRYNLGQSMKMNRVISLAAIMGHWCICFR